MPRLTGSDAARLADWDRFAESALAATQSRLAEECSKAGLELPPGVPPLLTRDDLGRELAGRLFDWDGPVTPEAARMVLGSRLESDPDAVKEATRRALDRAMLRWCRALLEAHPMARKKGA